MTANHRLRTLITAGLLLAPFAASCASTQYQAALDEREAENRALREERARLKGELRDAAYQQDALETALAEANARLLEVPDTSAVPGDPELDALGVGHGVRDGNMVYSVPTAITFAPGKAELSAGGKKALRAVAQRLLRDWPDSEYWVEGHTDSDPIRKSGYANNRELSLARAMAVLYFMVEESEVPDGRCVVSGWGEYRPVASNDTSENKARNRRVEIVVRQ